MRWRSCVALLAVACAFSCGGRAKRATESDGEATAGGGAGGAAGFGGVAGAVAISGAAGAACPPAFEALDPKNPHCGHEPCEPFPDANPRLENYMQHCCTTDGGCGAGSQRVYGSGCFERDAPGSPSDACPSQVVHVTYDQVSGVPVGDYFPGCCLPDGLCGLDTSASLGAGCVERSILEGAIHTTCTRENHELELESLPCMPSGSPTDPDE